MAEPLPARVPLTLYRGDSRAWTDTFTVNGEPLDLTGFVGSAQIRADPDSTTVQASIEVEVEDGPAGKLRRTLTATESAKLRPPRAYWDLQLVAPDGTVRTYLAGPVRVLGDVSRA